MSFDRSRRAGSRPRPGTADLKAMLDHNLQSVATVLTKVRLVPSGIDWWEWGDHTPWVYSHKAAAGLFIDRRQGLGVWVEAHSGRGDGVEVSVEVEAVHLKKVGELFVGSSWWTALGR